MSMVNIVRRAAHAARFCLLWIEWAIRGFGNWLRAEEITPEQAWNKPPNSWHKPVRCRSCGWVGKQIDVVYREVGANPDYPIILHCCPGCGRIFGRVEVSWQWDLS